MLQNFADAGKALFRVAWKYTSKVTVNQKFCFVSSPFFNFKLSIQLNEYFYFVGQAEETPIKKSC